VPPGRGTALDAAVGAEHVSTDARDRLVHDRGKSLRDLVRHRRGEIGRLPDVVVRPGGEDAVAAVLRAAIDADAVVIPSAAARTSRAASNRRRPTPARSSRSTSAGWTECWPSTRRRGSRGCITFGLKPSGERDPLAEYDVVKSAIQQKFVDSGATLSHHLAVGTEHAAWLEQDIPAPGVAMLHGLFDGVDPGGNLNPGKVI
jgi:FAD/FMN-containing dehydrogenase